MFDVFENKMSILYSYTERNNW